MKTKRFLKLSKPMVFLLYLVIWGIEVATFWLNDQLNYIGYAVFTFYLLLPITTFLLSLHIGWNDKWGKLRWFMILFFGFMSLLAPYVTFTLANMISVSRFAYPELEDFLPGGITSACGILLGYGSRYLFVKTKQ